MRYSFFSQLWRSKRSFVVLQISLVTISLIPLVLVQQATKSMVEEISNRIIETSSAHIVLSMLQSEEQAKRIQSVKKVVEEFPEIQSAFAEITGGGILRKGMKRSGITIRGVEPALFKERGFVKYVQLEAGRLAFENEKSIVLGTAVAEKLSAHVGDSLLLLTVQSDAPSALPKIMRFVVSGIVSVGYEELDRAWAFVPFTRAAASFTGADQRAFVKMKIADPFSLPNALVKRAAQKSNKGAALLAELASALKNYGIISSWYQQDVRRYALFIETKQLLNAVMVVAVLLAAITLSSTMGMRVVDLETDIAILKALGAQPKKLEQQLFLQALTNGIVSACLGIAGGVGLNAAANTLIAWADSLINAARAVLGHNEPVHLLNTEYYLTSIPFHIYWWDLLPIGVFAIALSVCATYVPVRRLRAIPSLKIIRRH